MCGTFEGRVQYSLRERGSRGSGFSLFIVLKFLLIVLSFCNYISICNRCQPPVAQQILVYISL